MATGLGDLSPEQHLVDAAYVDAEVLIHSREQFGISLVGPGRVDNSWQARTEGAYHRYCFTIDWEQKQVRCPQGNLSKVWKEGPDGTDGLNRICKKLIRGPL